MDHCQRASIHCKPASAGADQTLAAYVAKLLDEVRGGRLQNADAVLFENLERELYGQAIRQANGQQTLAARWLGVSPVRPKLSTVPTIPRPIK
jgi:DNA-binding protein Fis